MSNNFDELKESYRNKTPSQKLTALHNQISTPLSVLRGYARLMKNADLEGIPSEDFKVWIDKIFEAGEDIYQIVEALTSEIN